MGITLKNVKRQFEKKLEEANTDVLIRTNPYYTKMIALSSLRDEIVRRLLNKTSYCSWEETVRIYEENLLDVEKFKEYKKSLDNSKFSGDELLQSLLLSLLKQKRIARSLVGELIEKTERLAE